jgi:hypothetical protein
VTGGRAGRRHRRRSRDSNPPVCRRSARSRMRGLRRHSRGAMPKSPNKRFHDMQREGRRWESMRQGGPRPDQGDCGVDGARREDGVASGCLGCGPGAVRDGYATEKDNDRKFRTVDYHEETCRRACNRRPTLALSVALSGSQRWVENPSLRFSRRRVFHALAFSGRKASARLSSSISRESEGGIWLAGSCPYRWRRPVPQASSIARRRRAASSPLSRPLFCSCAAFRMTCLPVVSLNTNCAMPVRFELGLGFPMSSCKTTGAESPLASFEYLCRKRLSVHYRQAYAAHRLT